MNMHSLRHRHHRHAGRKEQRWTHSVRSGSLLLEAMLAIGIFAIYLGGIGGALLAEQQRSAANGDRSRAVHIAEQQLEAIRQMRKTDFDSITTGTHGVVIGPSGVSFAGTFTTTDGYKASVTVSNVGTNWIEVKANVGWNFGKTRSGSVILNTYLTNWRVTSTIGDWSNAHNTNITTVDGTDFQSIAISGHYLYLGSKDGKGVYIYDIANPSSPVRVASSLDIDEEVYGIVANDTRLFITTKDSSNDVQVFDITNPPSMGSSTNPLTTYNIPGVEARAIALKGSNLYVGTKQSGSHEQFYAFSVNGGGVLTLLSKLQVNSDVNDISIRGNLAYLATTNHNSELQVVDISNPSSIAFASGNGGVDLSQSIDATAVANSDTGALVGQKEGSSIDELSLMNVIAWPPIPATPTLWDWEMTSTINDIATVPGTPYAFIGSNAGSAELKVIDLTMLQHQVNPVLATYNHDEPITALAYNVLTDYLYAVSTTKLLIFAP